MRKSIVQSVVAGLALAGLLFCGSARAQIAIHDGSTSLATSANVASVSKSFTVTPGASVLVVSLLDRNNVAGNVSPATLAWGSQTLTRVVSVNSGSSTFFDANIYYLFNPEPGPTNITATDTSGTIPSAMVMQAYTLSGVDTTVLPISASTNNTSTTSLSVALGSGTPAWSWAAVCSAYATANLLMNLTSTGGTMSYAETNVTISEAMGYAANLISGSSTITASAGTGAGTGKMALGTAIFTALFAGPTAPTGLTATAQQNQVALSWTDTSGGVATGYVLWRSTNSSSGFIAIATNTGNASVTYTDTSVANWTTYFYLVQALDANGASTFSTPANATPFGLSAAPTGLAAVGFNTQAALSWNIPGGASTFNVLRSTTSGSGYATLVTGLTSPLYVDSGLANGTTYFYVVQAVNTFGTSGNSVQASATPQPLPAQTGIISVQDGSLTSGIVDIQTTSTSQTTGINPPSISKSITVTPGASVLVVMLWDQLSNTTTTATSDFTPATLTWGSQTLAKSVGRFNSRPEAVGAIYYLYNPIPGTHNLSFTDTSGFPVWTLALQAYTLNNVDTNAVPITNSAAGQFAANAAVTMAGIPFGGFASVIAGDGGGDSTFTNTTTSGKTNYQVVLNGNVPNFSHTTLLVGGISNITTANPAITATGPSGGVAYTLAVAAFTPVVVGPSTPANLTATGQQNQIALSWSDTSGGTAASYIISRSTTSGSGYVEIATNDGNANLTYTDSSVTDYTNYFYVVQAVNSSGTSPFSVEATAFAIGSPTVPTSLAAVGFDTQAGLTWTAQPSADSYNVLRSTTSGSGYTVIASGVTTPFYTDSGLANGTTYFYVVNSQNSFGTSADSAEASATPEPSPAPTGIIAVQDGSLTAMTNGTGLTLSVPITVTPGANALLVSVYDRNGQAGDGSPASLSWRDQTLVKMISEYDGRESNYCAVYYLADPEPSAGVITMTDMSGANASAVSLAMQAFTLSGVNNNDTSWPGPQAGGSSGDFAQVNTGVSFTFNSVPPGSFAVVSAMGGQNAANSEHIAATNGGTVIFTTRVVGGSVDVAMGGVANLPGGTTPIGATNNAGGIAGAVAIGVFSPLVLGPSSPISLMATGQTNQISLSWMDGSSGAATGYVVLRSTTSGSGYMPIATNSGNTNVTFTDTHVANYTPYFYVVDALDSAGSSMPSTEASAFAVGPPATPTGFSAVWGNDTATLNWNASSNATSYNVLRSVMSGSGFSIIASTATPGYVDATASNFTTYYYEVNAANTNGTSENTAQISVTPAPAPAQITVLDGSVNTMIDEDASGVSLISTNFTVSPGAGVLIVSLYDQNNQASDLSPATLSWGSQTLAKCVGAYNSRALSDCDIYYLFNPTPGTQTITAADTSTGPVYAMAMQVYTLTGVDTNQAVMVYSGSQPFAQGIPFTLSSATPAEAWAVVNAAAGNNTLHTTSIISTSGTVNDTDSPNVGVPNFVGQDVLMGGISDLAAGTGIITATNIAGGISFSAAVAVFAPAGTLQTPNAPAILPPHVDATGTNLVVSVGTQIGHDYYLLSTPSLVPPVVWTTNSITAGTGALITNVVPILPTDPGLFLQYKIQ